MQEPFRKFAEATSKAAGSPWAFSAAIGLVVIWAISGPLFGFSDTWQLVINTGTTIVTFLMVFLIQNAQNRDSLTLQLKLDELLCAVKGARDGMVNLEDLSEESLNKLREEFRQTAQAKERSNEIST
ncbi:low affinity iron permease family protein [Pusillimonas sp. TS35]|uniref:low affinity iron permease family protein n=1 Tax=Paracandidimonas lactea TaxID=2895524 RepID=UPI00136AE53D|nr:low affinity iron permease family protein [Paracandidimonas lactea]MYN14457.1 low affinity iron permease family protein [Pusillimonas sp. TS35]